MTHLNKILTKERCLLLLVLFLGGFFRFYRLDLFPLNYDEFWDTIQGNQLILNGHAEQMGGVPVTLYQGRFFVLYNLLSIASSFFTSHPVFVARLPAALIGTMTLATTYWLGKELYGRRAGFFSALFLACLPWHISMSRIGLKIILITFTATLCLSCLFCGVRKKSRALFFAAFALMVITCFYGYGLALAFAPAFIAAYVLLRVRMPSWPGQKTIVAGFLVWVLFFIPVWVIHQKTGVFLSNTTRMVWEVYFFEPPFFFRPDFWIYFIKNGIASFFVHIGVLCFWAESPMYLYSPSLRGPLLTLGLGWLAWIGVFYATVKRQAADYVLFAWALSVLFVGSFIIKIDNNVFPSHLIPYSSRHIFSILPVPVFFAARCFADFWAASQKKLIKGMLLGVIVGIPIFHCFAYFCSLAPKLLEWKAYSDGSEAAARFLWETNKDKPYGVAFDHAMTVPAYIDYYRKKQGGASFWAENLAVIETMANSKEEKLGKNYELSPSVFVELARKAKGMPVYFVVWSPETHHISDHGVWGYKYQTRLYRALLNYYPTLKPIHRINRFDGKTAIEIFKIDSIREK